MSDFIPSPVVEIPYQQLSEDALRGVIEEFIQREGTDYGEVEFSLEDKVTQVLSLLKSGQSIVVFDPQTESTTIMGKDELTALKANMEACDDNWD